MSRRRAGRAALAALGALAAAAAGGRALSSASPAGVGGPLAPCRDDDGSRRCYRDRRAFAAPPDAVFAAARAAVPALRGLSIGGPTGEVEADPAARTLRATFRVGLYLDTLRVAVEPDPSGGAVLYARSRSRVWGQDFGVNRRRVRALFAAVARALP